MQTAKMTVTALTAALAVVVAGDAFAQSGPTSAAPGISSGTHEGLGAMPRLERRSDGQVTQAPVPVPAERDSRQGTEPPPALTDPAPPPGESAASEARIRAMFEKQGYTNVQNIRKEGDAYTATAMKGGESVNLRLDPQLGQIQEHGG